MLAELKKLKPQRLSKNGTLLCGDVQALYIEEKKKYTVLGTYIHAIYEPLTDFSEIVQLKKEVPFLSEDYLSFLKKHNGLNLFSDTFCLYGFGRIWLNGNYVTSRDIEIVLPYHLGDYNKQNKEVYEIGTFCECKLLNDTKKQSYFLINKKNIAVAEWKSIESLIRDCINELITYYNENGKAKAPSIMGKIIFNKIIKQ